MEEFAFVSDLHLRRSTWSKHPDLWGDSYAALEQIIDYCIAERLPLVAAGDLFDKQHPDAESVKWMCDSMDRMQAAGLPVYFTQGQHERTARGTWVGVHSWPTHVDQKAFSIGNAQCYGLDWRPVDKVPQHLAEVPAGTHILVAHQVWADYIPFGAEASFADVPYATTLLTGDYHEHRVDMATNKNQYSLKVLSPGSMYMQALDEPPSKAFYRLRVTNAGGVEHVSIPLRSRPIQFFRFESDEQLISGSRTVPEAINAREREYVSQSKEHWHHVGAPIVVIEYDDSLTPPTGHNLYDFMLSITKGSHFFPKPYSVAVDDEGIEIVPPALEIQDDVLQACLEQIEPAGPVKDATLRMLNADDVATTIGKMFEEFMGDPSCD